MTKISEVAEDVYQFTPGDGVPRPCSVVYFIADERPALIETGPTIIAASIFDGLRQLGHNPNSLSYIALTHIHIDHAGGVGYLVRQLPEVEVIIHHQVAQHLAEPSRIIAGVKSAFGADISQQFGAILPVPEERIRSVQGGEVFSLGQRELKVIPSPGHAPHHICFFLPGERWLFSGDALGVYFPETDTVIPAVAPPGFALELALETADEIVRLSPSVLFYSHYGPGREVAALIEQAKGMTTACGQVVLEAMRAGENSGQVSQRLEAYLRSIAPNLPRLGPAFIRITAEGYMVYFRQKGMA
jgi:glyoxylase-like metal-dependent hydrolase (beta-lactamase superfamily II)